MQGAQADEQLLFSDYICPPEDFNYELGGNFYDSTNPFAYAQLNINACFPTETHKCASDLDIARFRRTGVMNMIYKDLQADLNNISMTHN